MELSQLLCKELAELTKFCLLCRLISLVDQNQEPVYLFASFGEKSGYAIAQRIDKRYIVSTSIVGLFVFNTHHLPASDEVPGCFRKLFNSLSTRYLCFELIRDARYDVIVGRRSDQLDRYD